MIKFTRCAIYIRVSTAEQQIHGKSLQAQREYLEAYAQKNNMIVTGIYADEGKTARKELKKRKAIHSLLDAVKRQEIDIILFWKMDRWFRNVSDFYKVQDVLDAHNVKWTAVAEPNMNMDTRDGRLNLNIMLSIGQNEVDTTSERIKFTNESIVNNGKLIFGDGNMPLGYKSGYVNGEKCMIKDESTEDMVKEFFDYFLLHQKKRDTVLHMQNTFGINFTYTMLRTMLSSEFYVGKYRNNKKYCPAYLTEEQWIKVQEISNRNIRAKKSDRVYLFSGLIRCPECGHKLVGTGCSSIINRKTREKRTYCYYRCNKAILDHLCNFRHRVSQNLIEEYLIANLEREFNAFKMRSTHASENIKIKQKKRGPEKIKKEMDNLNMMFQKERISWNYYDAEYLKLEQELKELDNIKPRSERNLKYVENILNNNFAEMYQKLEPSNRQSFWHIIIKEIIVDKKYNVVYVDFF